jgi:hypothetical protein
MFRTAVLVPVSLATVGLTAALVAGQPLASAGSDHTLRAHEKFTKLQFIPVPGKDHAFGEHAAFTTVVTKANGGKIGIGIGDCVRLTGSSQTEGIMHCTQTYHLTNGDIFVGGLYDLAGKTTTWAVLGGTGDYRGATGTEEFTTDDFQNFEDVFHLGS